MNNEIESYRKHRNLKISAAELGISWQTLYVRLKRQGEPVTGDKLRYGSDRDRLGAVAESEFKRIVPFAIDNNLLKFQHGYDFDVLGYKVDVKSSHKRCLNKKYAAKSWSFSFKKQSLVCDFMCCFCIDDDKSTKHVLLVPSEFFKGLQSVSVSCDGDSKWLDYEIIESELAEFFSSLPSQSPCKAA
ncbi:hypothetical protein [Propionivibrio sp.]|uniref:hypothetical protein n=1 Tax=Propionivibrio sp. TaxID=2212460 RepID=UPI003BF2E0CC